MTLGLLNIQIEVRLLLGRLKLATKEYTTRTEGPGRMTGIGKTHSATLSQGFADHRTSRGHRLMTQEETGPTLTTAERVAVALLFGLAMVGSAIVVGRLGIETGDVIGPPEMRPTIDADVPRPVAIEDAVAHASGWAVEWDTSAWPILVSAEFEYPVDANESTPSAERGTVLVTFAAPQDGDEWPRLTLAVSRQTGAIYHESALASEVAPPDSIAGLVAGLPITAEQAFRVAEAVVGDEYRLGCEPSRRQVRVVLDSTEREAPTWVVVYSDQRERNVNDIVVRIDAMSGSTDTEIRNDSSC